jgi:hypothetical protein
LFPEVAKGTLLEIVDESVGSACGSTREENKNNDGKTDLVDTRFPFYDLEF